jgi:hypothetical protein
MKNFVIITVRVYCILQVEKDSLFYIVESVEKEKALSDVILKGEISH